MIVREAKEDIAMVKSSKIESIRQSRRLKKKGVQGDAKLLSEETPSVGGPQVPAVGEDWPSASKSTVIHGRCLGDSASEDRLSSQLEESTRDTVDPTQSNKRSITEPSITITIKRPRKQVKEETTIERRIDGDQSKLEPVSKEATSGNADPLPSIPSPSQTLQQPVSVQEASALIAHGKEEISLLNSVSLVTNTSEENTGPQSPFTFKSLPQLPPQASVYDCSHCASLLSHTAAVDPSHQISFGLQTASDHLPSPFYPNTNTVRIESGGNFHSAYRDQSTDTFTERHLIQGSLASGLNSIQQSSYYRSYPPFDPWRPSLTSAPQLHFPPLPIPYSDYCRPSQVDMPALRRSPRQRSANIGLAAVSTEDANGNTASSVTCQNALMNGAQDTVSQRPKRSTSRPASRSVTPPPADKVVKGATKKSPAQAKKAKSTQKRCTVACEECREFKRKCTGTLPCKLCVDRHKPEKCRYDGGPLAAPRLGSISLGIVETLESSSPKVRAKNKTQDLKEASVVKKKKTKILTSPRFHGNRIPPTTRCESKQGEKNDRDMMDIDKEVPQDAQDIETSVDSGFEFEDEDEEENVEPRSINAAIGCNGSPSLPTALQHSPPSLPPHSVSMGRFHSSSLSSARPPYLASLQDSNGSGAATSVRRNHQPMPVRRTSWGTSNDYHRQHQYHYRHGMDQGAYSSPVFSSQGHPSYGPRSASALTSFPMSIHISSSPPANYTYCNRSAYTHLQASPTAMDVDASASLVHESTHQFRPRQAAQVEQSPGGTPRESDSGHHKTKSGLDSLADAVDLKTSKTG